MKIRSYNNLDGRCSVMSLGNADESLSVVHCPMFGRLLSKKYVFKVFFEADNPQQICQSAEMNNLQMFLHFQRLH